MIKLGPMKIGIRKSRFHQFDLRWGDTLVDGWDSFVGWVAVQRMFPLFRRLATHKPNPSGNSFHTVIVDDVDCNVTAEIAEE